MISQPQVIGCHQRRWDSESSSAILLANADTLMGLIIRSSDIHAAGCYTTTPIKNGTMIIEYTGPLISKDEGDKRYEGREYTYLFGMDDGRVIDGHGMAAF